MLETLQKEYIRTARSKGLKERTLIYKHAVRNALIPVVTVSGQMVIGLMGELVVVESIFDIRGMGKFLADAAQQARLRWSTWRCYLFWLYIDNYKPDC